MTTTASKHGLRAAATEKRNRHAQRTLLPPKGGVQPVEVPENAERYGKMTQPQLRRVAKELGLQSTLDAPKGKLLEAILRKERELSATSGHESQSETQEDRIRAAQERKRQKRAAEDAAEVKSERRNDKLDAALPKDSKSAAKATAIREIMGKHGWSTSLFAAEGTSAEEDVWELTAKRGNEVLWISWTKGVLTTVPMPSYTIADRTIKLRNASAVKQYAERAPEVAETELKKVNSNRFFRRKPIEAKPTKLPFDPATASEREIIDAIVGRSIAWHNRLRVVDETAVMASEPRRITFTSYEGERIVNWCCPQTGYRACRVTAITKVGKRTTVAPMVTSGPPRRKLKASVKVTVGVEGDA